jgi:cytoskeletal protein CcmA (bactofilin family)
MFKTKTPPPGAALAVLPERPKTLPRAAAVPSVISADMTIRGNLESMGDVQIEGAVIGDVNAEKLVIAAGGSVAGNVVARDVRICGALTGTVRGTMVTLTATARVLGDVHHELLAIETGGLLEGMSRRLVPAPPPAPVDLNWSTGEGEPAAAPRQPDGADHDGQDHGRHESDQYT